MSAGAAKLESVRVLDRDHLVLTFVEGEVIFRDDGTGPGALGGHDSNGSNRVEVYGPLDPAVGCDPATWTLEPGGHPVRVHRKTKIRGMAQLEWVDAEHDYRYATPLEHTLYLALAAPLVPGTAYRLAGPLLAAPIAVVFDPFTSCSEALHANLVGYPVGGPVSCDLYHWLGDGGARDYAAFAGAPIFLIDDATGARRPAGTVRRGPARGPDVGGYDLTGSAVWLADPAEPPPAGRWRLAVEGVGCTRPFTVGLDPYAVPFQVSVRGFYYMRIGEDVRPDLRPIPRQPRFCAADPPGAKIVRTMMHPYHPEWKTFSQGDVWDKPLDWARFAVPTDAARPATSGGHSDALDWDRHLGHVSIVYDMLLPYWLTGGAPVDDDCVIAESGNGVPDLLDEARNEADFWLSLRDGEGYSHGLTNPTKDGMLYAAAATPVAAWANAANAAMLGACCRLGGFAQLADTYRDHALRAWTHAEGLADRGLELVQDVGGVRMRGADFRITAAAFLFDLTGESRFEEAFVAACAVRTDADDVVTKEYGQLWAAAGYLLTSRPVRHAAVRDRLRVSILAHTLAKEVGLADTRPSRRATNQDEGYFHTAQNVQRTLLAHRLATEPAVKRRLYDALVREADWGLGRNPLNQVQMTLATTPLERLRGVENAYTSGRDDGTPGLHPGHTPYFNMDDWGGEKGMIMSRPRWMAAKGFPEFASWPRGETCFNTRWVWAHTEFTPQQTMRGKTALYGYLHGLARASRPA